MAFWFQHNLPAARDLYAPEHCLDQAMGLLGAVMGNVSPHYNHLVMRPQRQTSRVDSSGKCVQMSGDPNKFQVMLNVKHFKPEELSVKTVDNFVVIHGKHEESADEHGFVSREFSRRYALPEGVEASEVQSALSQDGVLTVHAPLKRLELPPENQRVVPITVQRSAAVEQQQQMQEQLQQQPATTNGV